MNDKIFIRELTTQCRIGIFQWERKILQKIVLDLEFPANIRKAAKRDRIQDATDYKSIAKHILDFTSKSEFFLIETLAEKLAASILKKFKLPEITLRVSKPGALRNSKTVGVQITRHLK
ncbi:MAG: dihydroneopterin aldolase [Candidatus Omnitrophica bacterium]|nr:dihydroneopterin aldolase [Candidatus Omnitrophota bacterium]